MQPSVLLLQCIWNSATYNSCLVCDSFPKGPNFSLRSLLGIVGQLLEHCVSLPGHADLKPQEFLLNIPVVDCYHIVKVEWSNQSPLLPFPENDSGRTMNFLAILLINPAEYVEVSMAVYRTLKQRYVQRSARKTLCSKFTDQSLNNLLKTTSEGQ